MSLPDGQNLPASGKCSSGLRISPQKSSNLPPMIDAKVKSIGRPGGDDFTIFAEMADYLPAFRGIPGRQVSELRKTG
jgi:hypothetical protein